MTIVENNNKWLIFNGDELSPHRKRVIEWQNKYFETEDEYNEMGERVTRNLNINTNPPYREVLITVDEGTDWEQKIWQPDEGKWVEKGTNDAFYISGNLRLAMLRLFGAENDEEIQENEVREIHFLQGQLPLQFFTQDFQEKWFAINKDYLKEEIWEMVFSMTGLVLENDGQKVIHIKSSQAEILAEVGNNVPAAPDNTDIQQYNGWVDQKLREFQEQFIDLQVECDEKEAFLMSLEKEALPEVREQINIVFSPWEVPKHKKMLTGRAHMDPTVEANNQVIETNNTQLIQRLENDFARKRAAIKELGKILKSIENPNNPEPDSPPTLQVSRQDAIDAIKTALNRDPKLNNDDLDQTCRDWEILINAANNEEEIDNIKGKMLINIGSKRKAKKEEKKVHDNLETEGKDADQLKRQFEEVEKSRGQSVYETNQTSINSLKKELFKKVSKEEYLQIVAESIEKFLLKCSVGSNDLALKSQRNLQKLKKGVIKDFSQINQAEEEVVKDAGQKGARKKLDLLFRQADNALRTGEKIKEIKNKLNGFRSSDGIYEKTLVSQKAKEIQSYLNQLENYSGSDFQNPSQENFPWVEVISIFLLVTFLILIGVMVYRKRRKNKIY